MGSKAEKDSKKRKLNEKMIIPRLEKSFFDVPCIELAKSLLGKVLVRKLADGTLLKGMIVETECYLGGEDKASHSYNGRQTPSNLPMYMAPGTAYVYMTYGMYFCFNISSREPGAAVLLRALDPLQEHDRLSEFRNIKCKTKKNFKLHELCNGPSKLCMSFNISKELNKLDMCSEDNEKMWIENLEGESKEFNTVVTSRIGIDSVGGEWVKKPLRFYMYNNKNVSRRDKNAEQQFNCDQ